MFSLTLATVAAQWGHIGVAVQSVGAQIEAITWMTAAGFSTALAAFTGQNFGARNLDRIRLGYHYTLKLAGGIALIACLAFLFFSKEIFSVFINEPQTLVAGSAYLKILAISQIFSAIEQVTAGAFNRLRTYHPARHRGNHPHGSQNPVGLLLGYLPLARPKRHLVEHLDLQRDEGHRAGYLVSIISKTPTKWTLQTHWNPRKNARRGKSSLAAI